MSRILRRRKCNQHQCILEMNGELRTSIQLTTNEEVTIIVWGSSSCTLRILAIGGGGGSLGDEANFSFSGGGGSGYIRYYSSSVFAGALELTAQVGLGGTEITDGSPSTVRMPGTTITARGGQCGRGVSGGDGYSGGGGWHGGNVRGGNGGTDGGNGGEIFGGSGTREDITSYKLSEFTPSPGQGGQYFAYSGGGGGGVQVGGSGPSRITKNQGEGYGGGRCALPFKEDLPGLDGVILVEVV